MRVSGCSWTPCCRGWKESLGFVYFPSDCRGKTFWFPLRPWPNWIIVKWTLSNFMFHNLWCAAQRREVQETHHQAERHGEPNLLNAERVTENSCEWVSRGHAPTYTDNIYTLRSAFTPGSALIQTLDPEERHQFWHISCLSERSASAAGASNNMTLQIKLTDERRII